MKFGFKGQKGFSIIELMVVVGIIGILTSIGLPKMQVFLAKAKRAEVKTSLGAYRTFQEAYYADTNSYGNLNLIGYTNMNKVYTFDHASNSANAYSATMTGAVDAICVGAVSEVWTMNTANGLTGDANAVKAPKCT